MAATCIAEQAGKNCFMGQLHVALFSNGPVSNATLAHVLEVVGGLLQGNNGGQALGLESDIVDHGLIDDVNGESTTSDVVPRQAASRSSKHLSGGIKALIILLCLGVVGLAAVLTICHFRRPVTKRVPDSNEDESEIHDTIEGTADQQDEIYGV